MVFNQDGTVDVPGISLEPVISLWDFRVAIVDFGFAMRFDPTSDCSTWISSSGFGTLPYNSPEKKMAEKTGLPFQVLPADVGFVSAFYSKH
jgi:serine/threonine protein kinase